MNTYQLKLDMNKGPTYGVGMAYSGITLRQGDKRGCTVVAELYDHGTRFTEAGYTAYFVMGLPDREHYYREAATYSAGTATIIIDESLAASVAGDTVAYFELTKGGATYSTQGIKVSVLKDARADKTPGETYDSRIEQAIEDLETAIAQAETQIEADVAEWLDEHPEATTTVQDGSITYQKLHSSTKQRLGNTLHRSVTAPVVTASDAYAAPPVALCVQGKSVQDGTPTPDAPVAIQSVESVGLAAAGVNLIERAIGSHTSNGITFTLNADGSVTANGTATATAFHNYILSMYLPAGTYHLSGSPAGGSSTTWQNKIQIVGGADVAVDTGSGKTFTLAEGATVRPLIRIASGCVCENVTFYSQLEVGSEATPYQPYVGSTTPIPLDGHALRSLPDGTHDELRVDSDGNVTLIQRVGHVTIDGTTVAVTNRNSPQSPATAYRAVVPLPGGAAITAALRSNMRSNLFRYDADALTLSAMQTGMASLYQYTSRPCILCVLTDATVEVEQMNAWFAANPTEVDYPLAEPVETPLGTVALPSMPAPDLTAWASCTPATDIELDYERSVTIAVERLEAAIAELATN